MSPSFLSRGLLVRYQLTRAPPRHTASTLVMMSSSSSSSSSSQADVVIAGGGMVGSAAAAAIGKLGCMSNKRIVLLEAAPEPRPRPADPSPVREYSNRVAALAPSSVRLLSDLGAWQLMTRTPAAGGVAPGPAGEVRTMRVWDGCSGAGIHFSCDEDSYNVTGAPLSYIVENDVTVSALTEVIRHCSNVEVKYNTKVKRYTIPPLGDEDIVPEENVRVELEDGGVIETPLLVGADGFRSLVRESISSQYTAWDYHQMGLVATLELDPATQDNTTAWQRFLPTGPVAVLPLAPGRSSLVWSLDRHLVRPLLDMDEPRFLARLNSALREVEEAPGVVTRLVDTLKGALAGDRGPGPTPPWVTGVANRAAFPLGFGHANRYIGPRTVLIGDAAHRVHPLAGQGVNLGFGDISCLAGLVEASVVEGGRLGQHSYLCQYETERQRHNLATMLGIDCLQRLYCTDWGPVVVARSLGLVATEAATPLKKLIMQHAS